MSPEIIAWLGAIATLLAALIGAVTTVAVQHRMERARQKRSAMLDIYFKLLALNEAYFWIASAQMRREQPKQKHLDRAFKAAWELADQLRRFDNVPHLSEILAVLMDHTMANANERAARLDKVIEAYGKLVNPAYADAVVQISARNILALAAGGNSKSYAPAAVEFVPEQSDGDRHQLEHTS